MDQGDSRQLVPQETPRTDVLKTDSRAPDEIRRDIEESRRQISESIGELRTEVSSTVDRALDWRRWVRDHPHTSVGIAFGVGLYFGLSRH